MCRYHVCQLNCNGGVHLKKHQIRDNRGNSKQQIRCDPKEYTSHYPNLPTQWVCCRGGTHGWRICALARGPGKHGRDSQ